MNLVHELQPLTINKKCVMKLSISRDKNNEIVPTCVLNHMENYSSCNQNI
jgi:hypothetical protein